jgi:hypothetical protein
VGDGLVALWEEEHLDGAVQVFDRGDGPGVAVLGHLALERTDQAGDGDGGALRLAVVGVRLAMEVSAARERMCSTPKSGWSDT